MKNTVTETMERSNQEQQPPELVSDAMAALGAAARLCVGKRMKHLDTQALFIQQEVNEKRTALKKCKGTDNPADAGTKPLTADKLRRLMNMVGMKFLTAAIVAARITGVKGVKIMVAKPEESYAMMLYSTATDVRVRVRETYENGLGLVD